MGLFVPLSTPPQPSETRAKPRAATWGVRTRHRTTCSRPFEGRFANISRFVPLDRLVRNAQNSRERLQAVEESAATAEARQTTKDDGRRCGTTRSSRAAAGGRPAKVNRQPEPSRERRIETLRKRNLINDQFRLSFVGRRRTFYLQLLTPMDSGSAATSTSK